MSGKKRLVLWSELSPKQYLLKLMSMLLVFHSWTDASFPWRFSQHLCSLSPNSLLGPSGGRSAAAPGSENSCPNHTNEDRNPGEVGT